MAARLHSAWSVELLGLANAVKFQRQGSRSHLLWTDGQWFTASAATAVPASGLPSARTMAEARAVGTVWINAVEADDA